VFQFHTTKATQLRAPMYRPRKCHIVEVYKKVKNIFLSMCDVNVFLTFTSLNLVLL
jgi:hypothetical protein